MASINSFGGGPERSAVLTIIMNFMVYLLYLVESSVSTRPEADRRPGSIDTTNEALRNRQDPRRDSRGCRRSRVEGTAISVVQPHWPKRRSRLHIPVEARTHPHLLPGGNS